LWHLAIILVTRPRYRNNHRPRSVTWSHGQVKAPRFCEKLQDIVGLYLNPPEHAIVLCADEKSQIQALDRTQPGLPMKQGRCVTMTHDYTRNGTVAALDVLQGHVISMYDEQHRHQEWLKFLRAIEDVVPAGKQIHMIVDNYSTHKR
jgi:hypothetical protein